VFRLSRLKKASTLKYAKNLRFDPYFCKSSCLKSLSQVLKRLKPFIQDLDLTIRRVDEKNETNWIALCLPRLIRMKKLRIEFPSTDGVDPRGMKTLAESYRKCFLLESLELDLIFVPGIGQSDFKRIAMTCRRLRRLEKFKFDALPVYTPQNEYKDVPNRLAKLLTLKDFSLRLGPKTGWTSITDGSGKFLSAFIESFEKSLNPIKFALAIERSLLATETVTSLVNVLPRLENLRNLFLEISKCKIGELELMILAEGFKECTQLKRLTFKFNDYSYISIDCLAKFAHVMSELNFLNKFDIFFRKLSYPEEERVKLINDLRRIESINFVLTKESLHVYRGSG